MVDLLDIDRLTLFLFLVVPGFIAVKVYDLLVPAGRRNFGDALVDVISYSVLNLALFGWILLLLRDLFPRGYLLALYVVLFVSPGVLAYTTERVGIGQC